MLRTISWALFVTSVVAVSTAESGEKQKPEKIELSGAWKITWAEDADNVNLITLMVKKEKIEGTYVNDAKEACNVTGQFDSEKKTVVFTIVSPNWEIKCDGTVTNVNLIKGTYLAYGTETGTFEMAREKSKEK
ncbi:MAG: hypothetical protein HY040_06975 [Planctomycetes bacterium]|nr:hypothetical protein [Planctomycetota bacterium]